MVNTDTKHEDGGANLPIERLPGLGPVSAGWLAEVGVRSRADLERLGAVPAYALVQARHPREASLNLLWGLVAALAGMRWQDIPPELKTALRAELRAWERRHPAP